MAKRGRCSSGSGERGGCLWRLADLAVIGLIAWAVAWHGPWKATTRPLLRDAWTRVAALRPQRPAPPPPAASPTPHAPTSPTPGPSPTAGATPLPSPAAPAPSPSPSPVPSPTPEPVPELDDALARLRSPRLAPDQSARADRVWEALGGIAGGEESSWRDNLACAADPEEELTAWETIADAYGACCAKYPALPDGTRREIFQVLLMRSLVPEAHVTRFVRPKELRPEEVRAVLLAARATTSGGIATP